MSGKKEGRLNYRQPHNIPLTSGNPALDARERERIHRREKHEARLTQRDRKRKNRMEKILQLANEGKAYCSKHEFFLCHREVETHHCYDGRGNPPVCPYLRIDQGSRGFRPYGK